MTVRLVMIAILFGPVLLAGLAECVDSWLAARRARAIGEWAKGLQTKN